MNKMKFNNNNNNKKEMEIRKNQIETLGLRHNYYTKIFSRELPMHSNQREERVGGFEISHLKVFSQRNKKALQNFKR